MESAALKDVVQSDPFLYLQLILKKNPQQRSPSQISHIADLTRNIEFFDQLRKDNGEQAHLQCCQYMTYETFEQEEFVFRQGEIGTKFYIILYGTVGVWDITENGEEEINILVQGDSFGDRSLIDYKPRMASIKCKSECHFGVLDTNNYNRILMRILKQKIDEIIQILKRHKIFQRVSRAYLEKIYYSSKNKQVGQNHVFYKQGEAPNKVFIIKQGKVRLMQKVRIKSLLNKQTVFKSKKHIRNMRIQCKQVCVAELNEGEIFGDEEVMLGTNRTTTSICISMSADIQLINADKFKRAITMNEETLKNYWQEFKIRNQFRQQQIKQREKVEDSIKLNQQFSQFDTENAQKKNLKRIIKPQYENYLNYIQKPKQPALRITNKKLTRQHSADQLAFEKFIKPKGMHKRKISAPINIHTERYKLVKGTKISRPQSSLSQQNSIFDLVQRQFSMNQGVSMVSLNSFNQYKGL